MVLKGMRRRPAEDGVVAVLVAVVVAVVVLPLMAIVVDLGLTRVLSQRSRGAADAAALAAAAQRPSTSAAADGATQTAKDLVAANLSPPDGGWSAAWAACTDPNPLPDGTASSPGNCISFDLTLKQVRVTVPERSVPSVFGGTVGADQISAGATSTATWGVQISPTIGTCALCVMQNYAGSDVRVTVSGKDAAAGGSLTLSSGGRLTVTGGGVTFGTWWRGNGGMFSPLPVKRPPPPDPLAAAFAMQPAIPYGQPSLPATPGPCTPRIYQDVTGCTHFDPGTYYVTGRPDVTVNVTLGVDATGVTLVFTCSANPTGAEVVAQACPSGRSPHFLGAAGAPHSLAAPASGTGFALVFDPGMTRSQTLNGAYPLTVSGNVYGPVTTLRDSANPGQGVVHGTVVVGWVTLGLARARSTVLAIDTLSLPPVMITDGPVRLVRTE